MTMNILPISPQASVFKGWEDLKLKCELEWPDDNLTQIYFAQNIFNANIS